MRSALVLLALGLTACARPVDVTGSPSNPACDPFVSVVPVVVVDERLRETIPSSASAAAWGDPPIVVRCGVSAPEAFVPTSAVIEVESVTWFAEPLSNGTLFTTIDRTPGVEVTVPREYAPEVNVLIDLSQSILETTSRS